VSRNDERTTHGTAAASAPAQRLPSLPTPVWRASRNTGTAAEAITNAFSRCAATRLSSMLPLPNTGEMRTGYSWLTFATTSPCSRGNGDPVCATEIASLA
jgi:hypothetical protein